MHRYTTGSRNGLEGLNTMGTQTRHQKGERVLGEKVVVPIVCDWNCVSDLQGLMMKATCLLEDEFQMVLIQFRSGLTLTV